MIVAERNGVVLRYAREGDFPQLDALTILCYTRIQASYVAMLGESCYEAVRHNPELTWEERKTGQVPIVEYWQDLEQFNRGSTVI